MKDYPLICKHCGVPIRHRTGGGYHDAQLVFPQYCRTEYDEKGNMKPSHLHEPLIKKED